MIALSDRDLKRYGDEKGPVTPQATLLLDKITYVKSGGAHPSTLLPQPWELANLAGTGQALRMLRSQKCQFYQPPTFSHATATKAIHRFRAERAMNY